MQGPILPYQRPQHVQVQERPDPWSEFTPNMLSAIIQGLMGYKIKQNLTKQELEAQAARDALARATQMDVAKLGAGYEQGEGGQWTRPQPTITRDPSGYSVLQAGGKVQALDPAWDRAAEAEKERAARKEEFQAGLGMRREELKARVDESMMQQGYQKDTTGQWTPAPVEFNVDPKSGQSYMRQGGKTQVLEPKDTDEKLRPFGDTGHQYAVIRGKPVVIPPGVVGKDGKPISGQLGDEDQTYWVKTGPETIQIMTPGTRGQLTENEAMKQIQTLVYGDPVLTKKYTGIFYDNMKKSGGNVSKAFGATSEAIDPADFMTEEAKKKQATATGQPMPAAIGPSRAELEAEARRRGLIP